MGMAARILDVLRGMCNVRDPGSAVRSPSSDAIEAAGSKTPQPAARAVFHTDALTGSVGFADYGLRTTDRGCYCSLNAIAGSVMPARQAGMKAASIPTASNAAPAAAKAIGSIAWTP